MRTRTSAYPANLLSLGRGGKTILLFIVAVVFAPGCGGGVIDPACDSDCDANLCMVCLDDECVSSCSVD